MLATETRLIDGAEYSITQLPARRAMRLFYRLAGVLAPAVGKLGAGGKFSMDDIDVSALGAAVEVLFDKLPPADFDAVVNELFYSLKKDGKPLDRTFDVEMAGQMMTVGKLIRFAFEANFGDFFDVMRTAAAQAGAQPKASASPASTT